LIGVNEVRRQSEDGGSFKVRTKYEMTMQEGLTIITNGAIAISYTPVYEIVRNGIANQSLINATAEPAKKADVTILTGGWAHSYNNYAWRDNACGAEGTDKPDMDTPSRQNELIETVVKANPKTIAVLMCSGPVDVSGWVDNVPAIVQAWYAGSEGGTTPAGILFGAVNPCGKKYF